MVGFVLRVRAGTDVANLVSSSHRAERGGAWSGDPVVGFQLRAAYRYGLLAPTYRDYNGGIRCARNP